MNLEFELKITIQGPVLTQSSAPASYGVDSPFARSRTGEWILPGTLIKGRIRDGMSRLHEIAPDLIPSAESWLGPVASPDLHPAARFNTRLQISDACAAMTGTTRRVRVEIDEQRQAAKENYLQVIEQPFDAGSRINFVGRLSFDAIGETAAEVQRTIEKALLWTGAIGANSSAGFGRILAVEVEPKDSNGSTPLPNPGDKLLLKLTGEEMLCVTAHAEPNGNLFESGSVIPGSVLKGAVASMWSRLLRLRYSQAPEKDRARPDLAAHFSRIRFSHAFPSLDGNAAPQVVPLSIADDGRDFALTPEPRLGLSPVPSFQPDWKESQPAAVAAVFPWPELKRELRVRTAINPDTRRADDGKLFAYEMICPEGVTWHAIIDCGRITDEGTRHRAQQQLAELIAGGISGIGKTKANLRVAFGTGGASDTPRSRYGRFVVTLQTAALLSDPRQLIQNRDRRSLKAAYEEYFHTEGNGAIVLEHFFAQQDLQGGPYLYHRFQKGRASNQYEPYLVTRPGSVFVFSVGDEKRAQDLLEDWIRFGLPIPKWAEERFSRGVSRGDHWSNHPYHPDNGFGQISVNHNIHFGDSAYGGPYA